MFSQQEIDFLDSQLLARVATANSRGQPDVVPVGLHRQDERFIIQGHRLSETLKYRNIKGGNRQVALVIDDQPSVKPWVVRGIKLHGAAEIIEGSDGEVIRFTPTRKWTWGLN
ncbi:MAG TPA: PPOX class F420-dependent oxidoreductase [Dehalococcoidia bacterium]|nr:PPOX class F420-dependent oxidoreductase [Dehalococcoidia bacterium]